MKKTLLLILITVACFTTSYAQPKTNADKSQYLLIIRFKADFKPSSNEVVQTNIKHWQEYMSNLSQSGSLVSGYRPANDGITIKGTSKTVVSTPYMANDELVSSVLVISA